METPGMPKKSTTAAARCSTAEEGSALMTPRYLAAAILTLILGDATAFVLSSGKQAILCGSEQSAVSATARLSACNTLTFSSKSLKRGRQQHGGQAHYAQHCYERARGRLCRQRAHKNSDGDPSTVTVGEVRGDGPTDGDLSFLDELVERCTDATRRDGAIESTHTGSSEWAGFKTTPELLEGVRSLLGRARQRSRHSDGSAMAWSWLTLSPRPVRVTVAAADPRFGVYLTVLPAGNGSPPSHRPMYGCHMLSRVLAGEVQQVRPPLLTSLSGKVKSNSQRVIGRSTHSLETPVWSSFGGGARRLVNENFQPAVILEVVLYDWSRGSGYSGSYAAPGTSSSGSAERRAEAEEGGALGASSEDAGAGTGAGPKEGGVGGVFPIVVMDDCPCPPGLLFRDGDVYEEEEEAGGDGGGLTLVRKDGKVAEGRLGGGGGAEEEGGGAFKELFTADELACDVGGLDGQLEDIVRRVLSTRSIPSELRQALGVGHVRGLLLHGPPGCGKTLLARELSRRLGARPPKLVSGPEILDKWVGEAERKVRLLFLDAELEHERCIQMGEDPAELPLNLVCFDEIDALCRRRGSLSGDTSGVRDSVVNQILTKMDGLVNLQNVLVVGMTNRKELLDEALLRPGRMEVCMPIPLPDAYGRRQILAIHLRKARDAGLVSPKVDDAYLAKKTRGFSGADLAGLVRSATSFAIADWRQRELNQAPAADSDNGNGLSGAKSGVRGGDSNPALPPPPLGLTADWVQAGGEEEVVATRGGLRKSNVGSSGINGDVAPAGGGENKLVITVGNFEQALLEVGVSGGGGLASAGGKLGALKGAVRGGLDRVLPRRG